MTLAPPPAPGPLAAGWRARLPARLDPLYLACIWVAGVAIGLMSLIVPFGVFTRYVLGTGSQWPEPIAILLMVLFTFIGAAAAYRAGAHIAVGMLTDRLPAPMQRALALLVHGLMLLSCGFVAWYGASLCRETFGQSIAELPWLPVGVTYLPIPIGAMVTGVFVIEHLLCGSQAQRPLVNFEHQPAKA